MKFSSRLKELREEKGMSQRELARALRFASSTLAMWESDARMPDAATLDKLSNYFGVTVDYLLGRTDRRQTPPADPIDAEFEALMNDPEARVILRATKGLPRHAKKSVIDYIEFMRRKFEEEERDKDKDKG